MKSFRAGHVPGLDAAQLNWQMLADCPGVEVPLLGAEQIALVTRTVREQAALHLQTMPVSEIIGRIDAAIVRLLDVNDPARQALDEWLPRVSGLDADMVRLNLNRYLKT